MLIIRPETSEDIDSIRYVNEQAFGQKEEAELVDKLRNRAALTLSLVAVQKNEVVGYIAFSPVVIESERLSFEAIALAPMAVLPAYQRKGIGFMPARPKGISCEFEVPEEAFMVLELREGALAGRGGRVRFQPEFGGV